MKSFALKYKSVAIFLLASAIIGIGYTNCGRVGYSSKLNSEESLGGGNGIFTTPIDTSASCPSGQVAIGLSANYTPICSTPQTVTGSQCPTGTVMVGSGSGSVLCLPSTVYTQTGQICPVGALLVSFTSGGSIVCSSYSSTLTVSCPAGQVLTGLSNNQPVCATLPTNTLVCPTGQYLTGIANGQAQCQNIWWNTISSLSCGNSQQLLGLDSSSQAVCQDLITTVPADQICASGTILKSNATPLVCQSMPAFSTAWMCPTGSYAISVASNKISCQSLPANAKTCPVGQYISGFAAGAVTCTAVTTTLPGVCPVGTYPLGVSNGALICGNFNNTQSNTATCTAGLQALCLIPNGVGTMTCNSDGASYSSCQAFGCLTGYALNGNTCVAMSCTPAQATSCRVANGNGQSICSSSGQPGPCTVSTCDTGYVIQGTSCIAQSCVPGTNTSCRVGAGSGIQTCNTTGTGYGSCTVQTCDAGYTLMNGVCNDSTAPTITLISTPTNPTQGPAANTTFSAMDSGSGLASVTCKLDSQAAAACTTSFGATSLTAGSHTLLITAVDRSGNTSTKTVTWVTDLCTTSPARSCAITNGTGVYRCQGDGSFLNCDVATCNTGYGVSTSTNSCVAVNCSAGYSLVNGACVDNTAPTITVSSKPTSPTIGVSTFTFSVNDLGSQVASVQCKLDSGIYSNCLSPLNLGNLGVGTHTLIIKAQDGAGNESSVTHSWSVVNCNPGSTIACAIPNATAVNTCASDGSGYGACLVTSCAARYQQSGNSCVYVPNGCGLPWGGTIGHGESVTAYQSASVAYNASCVAETRTCNDGTLAGSYSNSGCQVQAPPSELWTWQSEFYQTTCPGLCDGEQRVTCSGSGCPGSDFWSYVPSPPGQRPFGVGQTQTSRPVYLRPYATYVETPVSEPPQYTGGSDGGGDGGGGN